MKKLIALAIVTIASQVVSASAGDGGLGLEYRFTPHLGLFSDVRYNVVSRSKNNSLDAFRFALRVLGERWGKRIGVLVCVSAYSQSWRGLQVWEVGTRLEGNVTACRRARKAICRRVDVFFKTYRRSTRGPSTHLATSFCSCTLAAGHKPRYAFALWLIFLS
jgi:hypothetical protein